VQLEYQPLLADACASLSTDDLGLDGLYLYGSVARGDAIPGVSDLDLTLVLREPATAELLARLEAVRCALEQRHPFVTKVDFDIGHHAQVLATENRNGWGFWLKHQCRCLWGNDLSVHFERFRPSRDIALAVNGDFHAVLSAYLTRIACADTETQRLRLQREASRKLIRSTHVLLSEDASTSAPHPRRRMWRCSSGGIRNGSLTLRSFSLRPGTLAPRWKTSPRGFGLFWIGWIHPPSFLRT